MVDLIEVTYENGKMAKPVRKRVLEPQSEYLISLEDAVIVTKGVEGKTKLNQLFNSTAAGAASGSLWGFLVGMAFLMPIAGVLFGAAAGALGGKLSNYGTDDDVMKGVSQSITHDHAAPFLFINNMTAYKVVADLAECGGTVLRTSLDATEEKALDEHLKPSSAGRRVAAFHGRFHLHHLHLEFPI